MFWGDGLSGPAIHSAAWDGSNPQYVHPPDSLSYPDPPEAPWLESVVVNPLAEKVYWLGWYDSGARIERSNFDGSDRELIHYIAGWAAATDFVFDLDTQRMYWIAQSGIFSSDLDGGDIQTILASTLGETRGIGASFDHGWLFFVSDYAIKKCRIDGSGLQTIVMNAGDYPYALEVDPILQRVFWTSIGDNRIFSANLDGSDVQTLVTNTMSCGLALDTIRFKMYWGEFSSTKIRRANLDGTFVQDVGVAYAPIGFALDIGTRAPAVPDVSPRGRFVVSMLLALMGVVAILRPMRRGA